MYFINGISQGSKIKIDAGGLNTSYPDRGRLDSNEKIPRRMLAKNIISDTIEINHPRFKPSLN